MFHGLKANVFHSAMKAWLLKGTAMSKAALLALGIYPPDRPENPTPTHKRRIGDIADIAECMANTESPMDGRSEGI